MQNSSRLKLYEQSTLAKSFNNLNSTSPSFSATSTVLLHARLLDLSVSLFLFFSFRNSRTPPSVSPFFLQTLSLSAFFSKKTDFLLLSVSFFKTLPDSSFVFPLYFFRKLPLELLWWSSPKGAPYFTIWNSLLLPHSIFSPNSTLLLLSLLLFSSSSFSF